MSATTDSILSGQLRHFRISQRRLLPGTDADCDSAPSSKENSPQPQATGQPEAERDDGGSNGALPHLRLSPALSPREQLLSSASSAASTSSSSAASQPANESSTPLSSPLSQQPSSRSLPSTPTQAFATVLFPPSAAAGASPHASPSSASSSPSSARTAQATAALHTKMQAEPRYPSVGRISPRKPEEAGGGGAGKSASAAAAAAEQRKEQTAAVGGRGDAGKVEAAEEEPLGRPEVLDSSRSLPLASPPPADAAPPPPFKRSFSTSSTRTASRGIPLRSLAATSSILSPLTSPLRTPSPVFASTSPLCLSSASSAALSPSPPMTASPAPSLLRPFPSFEGLTPQTTIRTLKPLLTLEPTSQHNTPPSSTSSASSASAHLSASSTCSTPLSTATTLTPASAMRVLFTGQSGVGSGQPQPTTRRLSGKQSREWSPSTSPVVPSSATPPPPPAAALPPAATISTHSRHFSLTSPTQSPPVEDVSTPPPSLHRAATSDPRRYGSSALASVSDLYALPSPTPEEQILNGEEDSDSDEEDAEADASPLPPATPAHISGLFFHSLLSHLPFTPSAAFLQHLETSYAVLITLSLFYALFVDPIRLALLPASADRVLAVVLLLIFFLLLAEFAFFLHSNPSYCGSLEAALDCCALLSLLPQVAAMWWQVELTRIESALMMMMRAGVMVRLVGVLRLIPITSLLSSSRLQELQRRWKRWQRRQRLRYWQRHDKQQDGRINLLRTDDADDSDAAEPPPTKEEDSSAADGLSSALYPSHASRIGQLLSDYTAHRVVLGVLFVLLLYNYCHPHRVHTVHPYAVHHLESMLEGSMNSSTSTIEQTVQDYTHKYRNDLLLLRFDNVTLLNQSELFSRLRPHERQHIVTRHFDCWVNVRPWSQQFALFDFWSLLLVLLLLPVLLCLIYDDVHAVISPIERMRKFVTNLATDPMSEISANDQTLSSSLASLLPSISSNAGLQSLSSPSSSALSTSPSSSSLCSSGRSVSSGSFSLDSFFVELTLQRLAILLQLVFGSAGANIIANNIRGDYLEVVTPGRKVYAIFAFMGVEGWDGMMETLQVEMSELMNATAELVHSVCVLFGGEVNKNIGNAFLLVWKLEAAEAAGRAEDKEEEKAAAGTVVKRERGSGAVTELPQRRRSHHVDERTHALRPSISFPRSLTKELPPARDDLAVPAPSSSSSTLLPPPPASRRTVSHVPVASRPPQLLRRRRGPVQRVMELKEERKELPSPDDVDSPPTPVHCDENVKRSAMAEGRRNSLLSGILSLSRRDLGSIFTRSTLNLFGAGADTAAAAEDRKKEKAREESEREEQAATAAAAAAALQMTRAVTADLHDHLSPPLSERSHTVGAHHHTHSSHANSGSFYSRTHPTPPMPQPCARKHHGWKLNASNHRLAEQALCSFLLTLLQLSTSPSLLKWRQHPLLISHHLSLQFGIGLHVGWAIEGAIGSSHKIDASYLSPNVNLSSRLSVLCHHYHLPLLFSSAFHSLLGTEVQKRCRKVDVVSVKGSRKPIGIYTFDIDFGDVTEMEKGRREEREREGAAGGEQPDGRERGRAAAAGGGIAHHESFDERMRRKQVKEIEEIMRQLKRASRRRQRQETGEAGAEQQDSPSASSEDEEDVGERATDGRRRVGHRRASAPEVASGVGLHRSSSSSSLSAHSPLLPSLPHLLSSLQSHLPPPFIPLYNAACSCYIDGDWRSAGRLLVRVLNMRSGDGPSQLLLKVMAKEGFRAPTGWKGYRALTKK